VKLILLNCIHCYKNITRLKLAVDVKKIRGRRPAAFPQQLRARASRVLVIASEARKFKSNAFLYEDFEFGSFSILISRAEAMMATKM
jgi:hypothetical protein